MKKVVKSKVKIKDKYVTVSIFDIAMAGIAKSFDRLEGRLTNHDQSFELILHELKSIHGDNKHFRESILNLSREGVGHDHNIENLNIRVERLEAKVN